MTPSTPKLAFFAAWVAALAVGLIYAGEPAGHEGLHAGGRATFVHDINLYDADGKLVDPRKQVPYSPTATCGKCHDVQTVSCGWHFNAADPQFKNHGRPGEPWVYADPDTATQIPVSSRPWPGTHRPADVGLTPFAFTRRFGAQTPGGGLGDAFSGKDEPKSRWKISGKLEIDCLACHDAGRTHDPNQWARQIELENFKWAPTAAARLGEVKGEARKVPDDYDPDLDLGDGAASLPTVAYDAARFDARGRVHFDVTRQPPSERCYTCHSTREVGPGAEVRWQHDADVHLAHGMKCTDCHRDGIDHHITRGYPGETPSASLSCAGCHLGDANSPDPRLRAGGRLGAPRPAHRGLPPLHFDKLACTACHSGRWPGETAVLTQTSMAHQLGWASETRDSRSLPHVVAPVFARDTTGRIAPHRAVFPAFWGRAGKDGTIRPVPVDEAAKAAEGVLPKSADPRAWEPLTRTLVAAMLKKLTTPGGGDAGPVYVGGGKVYRLGAGGELVITDNDPAAAMYAWPIAHDVRPAGQSLGVNGCTDCHARGAPIEAGTLAGDWPQATAEVPTLPRLTMAQVHRSDAGLAGAWAVSFGYRGWFKLVACTGAGVVALVLLANGLAGLNGLLKVFAGRRP